MHHTNTNKSTYQGTVDAHKSTQCCTVIDSHNRANGIANAGTNSSSDPVADEHADETSVRPKLGWL
jgi:hypothetical protein